MKKIKMVLMNKDSNKIAFKAEWPHRTVGDMVIAYTRDGMELMKETTIDGVAHTEEEIFNSACENQTEFECLSISSCINKESLADLPSPTPLSSKMNVARSSAGAGVIFNREFMDSILAQLGEFYIIPSSIEEVILVPVENGQGLGPEDLLDMLENINSQPECVPDGLLLSNCIFRYGKDGLVTGCAGKDIFTTFLSKNTKIIEHGGYRYMKASPLSAGEDGTTDVIPVYCGPMPCGDTGFMMKNGIPEKLHLLGAWIPRNQTFLSFEDPGKGIPDDRTGLYRSAEKHGTRIDYAGNVETFIRDALKKDVLNWVSTQSESVLPGTPDMEKVTELFNRGGTETDLTDSLSEYTVTLYDRINGTVFDAVEWAAGNTEEYKEFWTELERSLTVFTAGLKADRKELARMVSGDDDSTPAERAEKAMHVISRLKNDGVKTCTAVFDDGKGGVATARISTDLETDGMKTIRSVAKKLGLAEEPDMNSLLAMTTKIISRHVLLSRRPMKPLMKSVHHDGNGGDALRKRI